MLVNRGTMIGLKFPAAPLETISGRFSVRLICELQKTFEINLKNIYNIFEPTR